MEAGRQLFAVCVLLTLLVAGCTACPAYPQAPCDCIGNVLHCIGKGLTDIPWGNGGPYNGIATVLLNNNNIAALEAGAFSNFPEAETIDLRSNKIEDVNDTAFNDVSRLTTLSLAENMVSKLSSLVLSRVTVLDLQWNWPDVNDPGPNAPQLANLTLANCALRNFPKALLSNTSKLSFLDLSGNYLETLDAESFQYSSGLETLNVSHNRISELRLTSGYLTALRTLDLSHNNLRALLDTVFDVAMPQLQTLFLDGNELTVPASGPLLVHNVLRKLTLGRCGLSRFTSLSLEQLLQLRTLDLRNNKLTNVQGLLDNSALLEELVLSSNSISSLADSSFSGAPTLRELYLDDNALETFDVSVVEALEQLELLDVSETPLACDCREDYRALERWAEARGTALRDECGGERVCEAVTTTDDPRWTTEAPCWDGGPACAEGEKCCPSGSCTRNGKCGGAAVSALPLTVLMLLGVTVLRAGRR